MSRFVIKWNNGYWKIFDTWNYTDVSIEVSRVEAELALKKFNESNKKG